MSLAEEFLLVVLAFAAFVTSAWVGVALALQGVLP